ncbi:MAG: anthranilate/aminodeoxychorismate synthase component II [Omnitrophica WOR_2 bacterium RIFCSPHIGHO2_02_FULL_52_10]|nr:MAG: anthranilate/aminodeoxychorismate synthase component II [Omnitrophica WOR_2 bacterium RIFCSPHIGHO2_02_FULL_52_10]
MILMIDNYDSFTYNLVQYFGELGADMKIYRNDKITLKQIEALRPEQIVISPGPGRPEDAGISVDLIKAFAGKIPILGVCLGHQCMGYAYGGKIVNAKKLMHGKTSQIRHNNQGIFKGIKNPFEATRYHSLVIERKSMPKCFDVTAQTSDGEVMGISHKDCPMWGVQFHPESILTTEGKNILSNFLRISAR